MHPTESVTLVHDRHRTLRASAPSARSARAEGTGSTRRSLVGPIRAAFASARHAVTERGQARPLTTHPSDC